MKKIILFLLSLWLSGAAISQGGGSAPSMPERVTLPNGWSLTPIGRSMPLGDLPLNIVQSTSKKLLAVTCNGQSTQCIELIDSRNEKLLDSVEIPKSWLGLSFSADDKYLYASGGNDNRILIYAIRNNKLYLADSIRMGNPWPVKISPAGLAADDQRHLLYVVTKENDSLYILDLKTKRIAGNYLLGGEGYTCKLSSNKKELYISCWGCDKLLVFDTETRKFKTSIAVGDNPNDICITKNNHFLFVANANDNSVSVIDLQKYKLIETLDAALYPGSPSGSTTNALALSEDERTLYVANADNNCLTVFDVSKPGNSFSRGFIPVGWYPTAVAVNGKKVFVANGKGFSSKANPLGPDPLRPRQHVHYQKGDNRKREEVQYIGGLFKGTMSIFEEPDDKSLGQYSSWVYQNTPYNKSKELESQGEPGNPIPMKIGQPSPIKHVFYIIKENRTYDQVLGDVVGGNGDTSLLLFGRQITPNQHALVEQFVLLDNFYCDAEVSADGHNWSMGAYADDYLEKTWPTSYGDRGGDYDGEGNRAIANNKTGFIWDHCKKAGISFRTYGEFADNYKPNLPVLKSHYCPYYTGWDLAVRDTVRFNQWRREFDSLLKMNAVPSLNTLRFGNDHTEGLAKGRPTPFAHVADNDLAVGKFIEYLSRSPIWNESVVFILEDDAQNGPDHVDAHRTTAYVMGGLVKRHYIDHTMYSTTSMLRTIELILGIPPMSQYDAAATPMWRSFSSTADTSSFTALPANVNLNDINTRTNQLSKISARFDFRGEDRVPEDAFNEVLWKGIKGMQAVVPVPRRAGFAKPNEQGSEADER